MDREMAWAWGLFARDAGLTWRVFASGEHGTPDLLVSEDPGAELPLSPALRKAWQAGTLQDGSADPESLFPDHGFLHLPGGVDDVLGTAFYRVNGLQEFGSSAEGGRLHGQLDRYGRFPFQSSLEFRLGLTAEGPVPFLPDAMGQAFRALHTRLFADRAWPLPPPVWFVSHDVDRVYHGWKEDGKLALRQGRLDRFVRLAGKRTAGLPDELDLATIQGRNRSMGIPGSWFVLPNQALPGVDPPDADYAWTDPRFQRALEALRKGCGPGSATQHIGLHAPVHLDLEEAVQRYRSVFGQPPLANRHHFLHFRLPEHYRALDRTGIRLDSSLAYPECPGFRNGYARPFHPFDLERRRPLQLLEVPFAWMDTTFKHYLQVEAGTAFASGESLLEHVQATGGVLGMLLHNDYLSGQAGQVYRPVLEGFARRAKDLDFAFLGFEGLLERYAEGWGNTD